MMHESGEVYVYMMRYFLGTNGRTNERTNKAILGVGLNGHTLFKPKLIVVTTLFGPVCSDQKQAPLFGMFFSKRKV